MTNDERFNEHFDMLNKFRNDGSYERAILDLMLQGAMAALTKEQRSKERREGAALILESTIMQGFPYYFLYLDYCRAAARDIRSGLYDEQLGLGPEQREPKQAQENTEKCPHHTHPIFPF